MKSTPFNPETDVPPIPFTKTILDLAFELKTKGLPWKAHPGCFVWDKDNAIPVPSPFPLDIYFILNLNRFTTFFDSMDLLHDQLVWLPTWHQARICLARLQKDPAENASILCQAAQACQEEDLPVLYKQMLELL